ncbi:MAG: acyltransferase [Proteobacteria bacterium]|nr:acyltransferase [Pseudomonadota bacterium]MCZ6784022.1 acyltransferase [Pseudomonadota bacterium]
MRSRAIHLFLACIQRWDRLRLRWLHRRHPGLDIHPLASTNFASARFVLAEGARLSIGAGVVTERRRDGVHFQLERGAQVVIGDGTWIRSEVQPVHVAVFEGASLELGPDCFLNGCHVSAKERVTLGTRVWVGPGARIFDADQHDLDADRPEVREPVVIRDYTWIASDVTVLRGVEIGEHCVVGTRSLVTSSLPPHTLAYGTPAVAHGRVGDRSKAR